MHREADLHADPRQRVLPRRDGRLRLLGAGGSEKVRLTAARMIEGKAEPMDELDFEYPPRERRWVCEFVRPRAHGLRTHEVAGRRLIGTLYLLPGNEVARNVVAHR